MLRLVPAPYSVALGLALATSVLVACSSDDSGDGGEAAATSAGGSSATTAGSGAGSTASSAAVGSSAAASSSGQGGAGGATGDTWDSYAMGFFATYCIECHGAGDALRDYTTIDDVKVEQAEIRCGVAATTLSGCSGFPPAKQFPVPNAGNTNAKPTDPERDRLVAWIEAGLPE